MVNMTSNSTETLFYENGFPAGVGTNPIAKRQPWREILTNGYHSSALADAFCKEKATYVGLTGTDFPVKTTPWQPDAPKLEDSGSVKERRDGCGQIRLLEELDAKSRK